MIGLKRGSVKLLPHNKNWEKSFSEERRKIMAKLGDLVIDVHHIGSTAVPGIEAKPIIDMAVGIRRFKDADKLVKPLQDLGYNFDRSFQHQRFFAKGSDSKRTHYLHVMRYKGSKWKSDALFRDYLVSHPERAKAYSRLKILLSKQYAKERQKYSDGKNEFIKETIRLAKRK